VANFTHIILTGAAAPTCSQQRSRQCFWYKYAAKQERCFLFLWCSGEKPTLSWSAWCYAMMFAAAFETLSTLHTFCSQWRSRRHSITSLYVILCDDVRDSVRDTIHIVFRLHRDGILLQSIHGLIILLKLNLIEFIRNN